MHAKSEELDYKGVSYEPIERCYSLDRKEDLPCANVRAEVPTLVLDDGRTIADSTIRQLLADANSANRISFVVKCLWPIWQQSVTCRTQKQWE
jgi:hypothetical protein